MTPLSSSAKWAVGFGLITLGTTVAFGPLFAFAQLFNGDDIRDGWLTGLITVFGGCGNVLLGVTCGAATLLSSLQPMRSESPRDRNAARLALALLAAAVLVVLRSQVAQRS